MLKVLVPFSVKHFLYIRNLKYSHLKPIFRRHNIHLVSSTSQIPTQIQMDIVSPKSGFKREFSNINNHLFFLKAKNSLHATRISLALNTYLPSFLKKKNLKYTFLHKSYPLLFKGQKVKTLR